MVALIFSKRKVWAPQDNSAS